MADEAKQRAREELRNAQAAFERAEVQREQVSTARRESFERAQAAGLTLREIGEIVGLHHTRIGESSRRIRSLAARPTPTITPTRTRSTTSI